MVDLEEAGPPIDVPGAVVDRVEGSRQWLRFHGHQLSASELVARVAERVRLVDLAVEETDIEDVVRRIYLTGRS